MSGKCLIGMFPQMRKCFCCCKVETGSKVIACVGMALTFILSILILVETVVYVKEIPEAGDSDKQETGVAITVTVSALAFVVLVAIWSLAIILLIGLYKEEMGKVKCWLIVNIWLTIIGFVGSIIYVILIFAVPLKKTTVAIVLDIVSQILQTFIALYTIAVVKSHYYNMTKGSENREA